MDTNSYEQVRILCGNHLALVLSRADKNTAQDLWDKIDEKIDCYLNGNLDHAVNATTLLWKLSKGGVNYSGAPPTTINPVSSIN